MSTAIRPASPDDRHELIELLERNIPGKQKGHFAWRHEANPVGRAWSWVLYEKGTDAIVAMTSLFPRRVYVAGKPTICGIVGEFVVDVAYRSLGPAVALQRATFEPVQLGKIAFCFDTVPHDQGMSTFVRLGMRPNCDVVRYALLLRADEFVEKKMGPRIWTKPAVISANLVLRSRRSKPDPHEFEISEFRGAFDEEFSSLDKQLAKSDQVRFERSAEFLNWSFRGNPESPARILVARHSGELVAFLGFRVYDGRVSISNLFGRQISSSGPALIDALIDLAQKEKMHCIESHISHGSETTAAFNRTGFHKRETAARVVTYPNSVVENVALDGSLTWEMSRCDTMLAG